jgi:hypothetical protein
LQSSHHIFAADNSNLKISIMQLKFFFIWTALFTFYECSSAQNHVVERRTRPTPPQEDSVCSANFPNNIALEADSIETFLLDGWKKDTSEHGLEGFKIEKTGKSLTGAAKQQFIALLKKPTMYQHDSIFKRCEFVPNVGFRWHSKGKSKVLLMALNCDVWKWYGFKPHTLRVEADPAHDTMMAFMAKIFPASDYRLFTRGLEMGSATATDPFEEPIAPRSEPTEPPVQFVPSNDKATKSAHTKQNRKDKRSDEKSKKIK